MQAHPDQAIDRSQALRTTVLSAAMLLVVAVCGDCQAADEPTAGQEAASTAALRWDDVAQTLDLPWDAKTAKATYRCTNTGTQGVRIIVDASCGCLATAPEPNPLPAGASGVLTVSMPIGFRSGLVTKPITITTDPPSATPVTLQLSMNIPKLATIRPSFLHWRVGEAATTAVATATIEPGFPVTFTGIKASASVLDAVWEPDAARTGGTIRVTPRSTLMPWNGTVVLLTDAGRDFVIFCRCIAPDVKPASAPERR